MDDSFDLSPLEVLPVEVDDNSILGLRREGLVHETRSVHVPLTHGLKAQSSMSISQFVPVKPA